MINMNLLKIRNRSEHTKLTLYAYILSIIESNRPIGFFSVFSTFRALRGRTAQNRGIHTASLRPLCADIARESA